MSKKSTHDVLPYDPLAWLKEDESVAKSFAIYHDTIIFNIHTKVRKYKQSQYFDNPNVKDIENQGYTIPFFIDEKRGRYILLGMVKSN